MHLPYMHNLSRSERFNPRSPFPGSDAFMVLLSFGRVVKFQSTLPDEGRFYNGILEQLQPEHPDARWNLALLHLQRGDYRNGWPLYESRHDPRRQTAEVFLPPVNTPMWRGESLAGKHLLIWHEQGMGDEIQFARFIPQLRARFAVDRITLFCKSPLQRLLRRIPGVDHCLPLGAGRVDADAIWARARLQMEANRSNWARITLNYLPDSQMPDSRSFEQATGNAAGFSTTSRLTISPAILAKRFTRPTILTKPSSSSSTTSPVSYQPSPTSDEGACSTPGASDLR